MRTLVTGGTGFLGQLLVQRLLEEGRTVRLLERRPHPSLDGLPIERAPGDVTDASSLAAAFAGVERVFHLAGLVSHREADRDRLIEINVGGTANVMAAARSAGVTRVVHASSVASIGMAIGPEDRADETRPFPDEARRFPYPLSKHQGEAAALRAAADGLDVVVCCPAFVIGAGDVNRVSTFPVDLYMKGQLRFTVAGGLNYVDARDVVEGLLLAEAKGQRGERYILGSDDGNLSHAEFFARVGDAAGVRRRQLALPGSLAVALARVGGALHLPPSLNPIDAGELASGRYHWYVTSRKAETDLGYAPRSVDDAIAATVDWYRATEP